MWTPKSGNVVEFFDYDGLSSGKKFDYSLFFDDNTGGANYPQPIQTDIKKCTDATIVISTAPEADLKACHLKCNLHAECVEF